MSKTKTVTVYGASDDLLEIEGALREEFPVDSEVPNYVAFSDGTVLRVEYAVGGWWRIRACQNGTAVLSKKEATDEYTDYSDRVTLVGEALTWVVVGPGYVSKRKSNAS